MFLKLLDIKEKVRQNPTDNYVGALFIPCQKPIDKYKEILFWEWHVHLWHAVILMPLMTFPCIRDIHEIIFLNKSQKKEYSIPLEESIPYVKLPTPYIIKWWMPYFSPSDDTSKQQNSADPLLLNYLNVYNLFQLVWSRNMGVSRGMDLASFYLCLRCLTTLREESKQTNVILQYKLLAAVLSAVWSEIQQS